MICIDASALIAILRRESEAGLFAAAIAASDDARMAAPSALEYAIVATGSRHGFSADGAMELVGALGITIVPFDADMAGLALDAFLRFGKGRHAAALNFGDCIAYALARALDAPLLFKGGDFARTDIKVAAV